MKKFLCAISIVMFWIFSNPIVNSQSKSNSVYFELLGNGILYTLNYDILLGENYGIRIGFSYTPEIGFLLGSVDELITVPFIFNYFIGNTHKLELGGGFLFTRLNGGSFLGIKSDRQSIGAVGTTVIGYRYQKPGGGFLFRAGFTPFLGGEKIIYPFFGISFGFSF